MGSRKIIFSVYLQRICGNVEKALR